jgi:hypothetical protein
LLDARSHRLNEPVGFRFTGCAASCDDDDVTVTARTLIDVAALRSARQRCRPASPAALAKRIVPNYRIVPTVALISDVLLDAIVNPDRRYVLSTPPRSGKSLLCSVVGPLFALMRDPDASIIVKSYADTLATEHSGQARRLVGERAALLGFEVDQAKSAVDRWLVAGRRGGVLSGGILSATTGFGVSGSGLLVVDDPVKGHVEADSPAYRRRLVNAFRADLLSRLHPGAGAVVVTSRWDPADLAGELLADDGGVWRHVNIPAIATAGVADVLRREPGTAVVSALGRDLEGFREIKRAVGSRAWSALYLGAPSTDEGSLIRAEWLDGHRLPAAPARPVRTVVAVDPSDSGSGDLCGIVGASLAPDGAVCLIADVSEQLTSDAWANRTVELAMTLGASAIHVEGFSAATTYVRLVTEALHRQQPPHHITVSTWPPKGRTRVGDALARSAGMLAALENGSCVIAGHLPDLEAAMVSWQPGSHQPDAVAAAVIAFDVLFQAAGQRCVIAAPVGAAGGRASTSSASGGFLNRLGSRRPLVDALVAESAAHKRAAAAGTDPDDEPQVQRAAQVVSMASYLSRCTGASRSTPFGPGYDPLAGYGDG